MHSKTPLMRVWIILLSMQISVLLAMVKAKDSKYIITYIHCGSKNSQWFKNLKLLLWCKPKYYTHLYETILLRVIEIESPSFLWTLIADFSESSSTTMNCFAKMKKWAVVPCEASFWPQAGAQEWRSSPEPREREDNLNTLKGVSSKN